MDWIEQLFGIDPDMGSGSLEILIAGALVLILIGFLVGRRRKTPATVEEKVR
ncbi:MAG TPA: LPXTG cell wall anchor domain-containing protein [Methylomirabilota bacterium]|nr:LPXTG cell wall anchor domain-containing protein [Methylomirabilota bacterium]